MEEQEENKSKSGLKIVVVLLALLLGGSLIYIYQSTTAAKQVEASLTKTLSEKELVMKDLQDLKTTYDAAIAENTSMSEELIKEREKVVNLMNDVKNSKGEVSKFKGQYNALQSKMKALVAENDELKVKNTQLTVERDSTKVVLEEAKVNNEVLATQNNELVKTVEIASKLTILNLKTTAVNVKSPGFLRSTEKQSETDKASKANMIKISFTIAENQVAKSGDKSYYVQVIDSNGNVLGDKQTVNFGDESLTYSFITTVKYENKTVDVSENLPATGFVKGEYFVYIFDKNVMVSKSGFTLK
jgi:regulator of replication initiation timing